MRLTWLIVAACSGPTTTARSTLPSNARAADPALVPLERAPQVDPGPLVAHARRDCRPSARLAAHFGSLALRPCGALPAIDVRDFQTPKWNQEIDAAWAGNACITDATARGEPFVIEQGAVGDDTYAIEGRLGATEHGELVVYRFVYVAESCGGCEDLGTSHIERCSHWRRVPGKKTDDCVRLDDCFACDQPVTIEKCSPA